MMYESHASIPTPSIAPTSTTGELGEENESPMIPLSIH
jgi:hypothetical protein